MSTTIGIYIKKTYRKPDGTSPIYLRVTIDRKHRYISLNISWFADAFAKNTCKPSKHFPESKRHEDNNLTINNNLGKASQIITKYRLMDQSITWDLFMKEWNAKYSTKNFVEFYESMMHERLNKKRISLESFKTHRSSLNKLKKFSPSILFSSFSNKWADDYDHFLRYNLGLKNANTIWGAHKDVRTYMNIARKEHIPFEYPYEHFSISKVPGSWVAITKKEIKLIHNYYLDGRCNTAAQRSVLRRFLFSCLTSLRLSDLKRLSPEYLINDWLVFEASKTRKKSKIVNVPLVPAAKKLLLEEWDEYENAFRAMSDQKANEYLKLVAKNCEIQSNLHTHIGRETFATLFLENGGKVEVLQRFLAHSSITTTMKYVHISQQRKKEQSEFIAQIMGD